ncbi:tRNA (N6-threonylcarbamoyladenosine(37)-N6)-methyltransferase TrmO [Aliiglaciecola sp. CAU 1673]|uniref:tRNA (N6-threonylcarbamoyladenosine(37)-N6)-methyltransferase TrmO n=1 Tax=Aliiglaciecola sp. CAU 1673 TaxID=3032595 RepID=UPI0023DC88F5|nr:tRNA (N6-threonylcarbamoyladenosine(37)-N6)-methyltransferase TrmO [Aliiglaciecola sp. CAU 1673]MDF2179602.1 tRNA (N6-threonylcarbamoyladenosine(37)-N6)-methyltransferase TrmO [Aliiglaciecola sp. CAU 1673]
MQLCPIGFIRTPYKEKFAIPRQPGLVAEARGEIHFQSPFDDINCFRGIENYSHLWLLFHFHQTQDRGWSPLVRPPRLGGNAKMGVFATRSTHRPNGIGMSVVKLQGLESREGKPVLIVSGMDLLDGTPLWDIKPYIPYADALPDATGGMAQDKPALMAVEFSQQASEQMAHLHKAHLHNLIAAVLAQDPRPAYKKQQNAEETYGMRLEDINVRWTVADNRALVMEITLA